MRRTGSSTSTRLIRTVEEFLGIVAFISGHFMNFVVVLNFIGNVAFIPESYMNFIEYEDDLIVVLSYNFIVLSYNFDVYRVRRR